MVSPALKYQFLRIFEHLSGRPFTQSEKVFNGLESHFQKKGNGKRLEIPRIRDTDDINLLSQYMQVGQPVIIEGRTQGWNCFENWSIDRLIKNFGDETVPIVDSQADGDHYDTLTSQVKTLGEVLTAIKSGDKDQYLRFNDLLHRHPELMDDVDQEWFEKVRPSGSFGGTLQLFIGAKDSRTSTHAAVPNNLFLQVEGVKHWYLISPEFEAALSPPVKGSPYFYTNFNPEDPDYTQFPLAKYADYYEFDLHPGEILFNPTSWWHYVKNQSYSLGLGYRWVTPKLSLKTCWPQLFLTLAATHPPFWYTVVHRTDYTKMFTYIAKRRS